MKKSKRNYIVIALIVILLTLAVVYAAFSDALTITGTATGSGTFDVEFVSGTVSNSKGTATVSEDKNTLTVNVNLGFPGDGAEVTAVIKNNSSVAAKLTSFDLVNQGTPTVFSNADIEVDFPSDFTGTLSESIPAGGTCTVKFTVKWKGDSTATSASAAFDAIFEYEQDTTPFEGTPSHGTHT